MGWSPSFRRHSGQSHSSQHSASSYGSSAGQSSAGSQVPGRNQALKTSGTQGLPKAGTARTPPIDDDGWDFKDEPPASWPKSYADPYGSAPRDYNAMRNAGNNAVAQAGQSFTPAQWALTSQALRMWQLGAHPLPLPRPPPAHDRLAGAQAAVAIEPPPSWPPGAPVDALGSQLPYLAVNASRYSRRAGPRFVRGQLIDAEPVPPVPPLPECYRGQTRSQAHDQADAAPRGAGEEVGRAKSNDGN